jgi:hypothetical protein
MTPACVQDVFECDLTRELADAVVLLHPDVARGAQFVTSAFRRGMNAIDERDRPPRSSPDVLSFSGDDGVSLDLAAADTFGAKDELTIFDVEPAGYLANT